MKKYNGILFIILFFFLIFPAVSQDLSAKNQIDFYLLSVIETAFSGDLRWHPDWPQDFPSDGFNLSGSIELANDTQSYAVRRDGAGRLVEFPFFQQDGYLQVTASYAGTGALRSLNISSDEKNWSVAFPADFLPYSDLSLGGSFPPIAVRSDDSDYWVFIFESPGFLTETWYDDQSNMITFCKALVNRTDETWRIRSLQMYDESGINFVDYFYDSFGNISEVSFTDAELTSVIYSARFRNNMPVLWKTPDYQYELQWDTKGLLRVMKATSENGEIEYRYEYEESANNWVRREETAIVSRFDLLVPSPSYSRGVWTRRVRD